MEDTLSYFSSVVDHYYVAIGCNFHITVFVTSISGFGFAFLCRQ